MAEMYEYQVRSFYQDVSFDCWVEINNLISSEVKEGWQIAKIVATPSSKADQVLTILFSRSILKRRLRFHVSDVFYQFSTSIFARWKT